MTTPGNAAQAAALLQRGHEVSNIEELREILRHGTGSGLTSRLVLAHTALDTRTRAQGEQLLAAIDRDRRTCGCYAAAIAMAVTLVGLAAFDALGYRFEGGAGTAGVANEVAISFGLTLGAAVLMKLAALAHAQIRLRKALAALQALFDVQNRQDLPSS